MKQLSFLVFAAFLAMQAEAQDSVLFAGESHFKNIIQLTNGGDNAEAYWSYDSKRASFQRTNPKEGINCDQIFMGLVPTNNTESFTYKLISGNKGRTTCSFFTKDGAHIIYASTKNGGDDCPPTVDRAKYGNRYIWPLYASYDIFIADTNGKNEQQTTLWPPGPRGAARGRAAQGGVAKKWDSVSGKGDSPVKVDFRDAAAAGVRMHGNRGCSRGRHARKFEKCSRGSRRNFLIHPPNPYVLINQRNNCNVV
jgi:hypothetical protein